MSLPNFSEAAERNKEPILQVLRKYLSNHDEECNEILEIASGFGQHVQHFATEFTNIKFYPSELSDENFPIITERTLALKNVQPPTIIDISSVDESLLELSFKQPLLLGVIAINLVHISPFNCCSMLMKHAGRLLKPNGAGYLFLYGPFNVNGEFTSEGNQSFDQNLKLRNPQWGIRDVEEVEREANRFGLKLVERVSMPANNFTLVFTRE